MISRQFVALATLATAVGAQQYHLSMDFSGPNFFEGFKYNESAIDSNNFGNVHFLGQDQALASNLTFVDSNGHAIIKVDNTTNGAGDPIFGRNTVYLMSNEMMSIGSLLVFDANHIPFGCSVWPALFTQGQQWPEQGEIDIVEQVNRATKNQYSLHTGVTAGTCMQADNTNQTGKPTSTPNNCTVVPEINQNTGCVVQDASDNSFGSGFNRNGGGVYAMLWDENGIAMWFWERNSAIPSRIDTNPDPTKFSTPAAFFPASGCNPSTAFGPQIITLYIDICGAFAGNDQVFQQTCGSVAPNCADLVRDPANYADAYWDINYLRVFTASNTSNSTPTVSSDPGQGPTATTAGGGGSSTSPSSGNTSDNAGGNSALSLSTSGTTMMSTLALFLGVAALGL
ncbi:hypothetical protein D9758_012674 [Tetrapyrgos nigripes]|uniref:GH16 domain-containing protein n=1 Tax=Tetrapyrgos nigripes TaxID=182062 RepID=A0A8H5FUC0_9AGAR|nr:hypothetical protein D9758_012674 [Tetrapyrgos nigripes]